REVPEVKVSGLYVVIANNKTYFMADTTVIVDPTPEEIADIACHTVDFAKNFEIDPGVALLSYSNFGSAPGQSPGKMARAREIIQQRRPELIVEGEMQANTALSREMLESEFPFSLLKNEANVLIFPDLNSGNIAYKLLHKIGKATIIGPVLQGLAKSVHVLQRSDDINDIVNMAAIAVVDAQQKENS
ncbi:MAG: phosphate acyltransferase, partial [Bacteroidota bacterium]